MSDDLFPDLRPVQTNEASGAGDGAPRLETANRSQIELTPTDLESLLPPGHAARLVWRFVEGLDLQAFYDRIAAREGRAGRPAIDPKILIALWLYATIDGVGSARELDRLCYSHDAYRWLRGGVSVNDHTLSDFRVQHQEAVDALLTQSVAVLVHRQVVTLTRVAQDGTRVRASAGLRSFRRRPTLEEALRVAGQQVKRTAAQVQGEVNARQAAAQQRAVNERLARLEEALAEMPAVEAAKARNRSKSAPRVSTTDPHARVMKMMDGGYRPAYNVQFATDVDSQVIVGVAVTNVGSDQAELVPMLDEVTRRTGAVPAAELVDGGYVSTEGIREVTARGVVLYAPVRKGKTSPGLGAEGVKHPAIAAWRARMDTDEAKAIYRTRAGTAERINADARTHRTLRDVGVRGLSKVLTWALWIALAQNVMRAMEIIPHLMT
jgi:transposase